MTKILLALFIALSASVCSAYLEVGIMAVTRDADLKWVENPQVPGLSQAVLLGNPSQPGLYVIRVRFAPGVIPTYLSVCEELARQFPWLLNWELRSGSCRHRREARA